jgi:hypothetical protein
MYTNRGEEGVLEGDQQSSQEEGPPFKKQKREPSKKALLTLPPEIYEYETAFDNRLKSYFLRTDECKHLPCFLSALKLKIINLIDSERRKYNSLKVNMVIECTFVNINMDFCDRAFKTRNSSVFLDTDLNKFVENCFTRLRTELEEAEMKKSGWTIFTVDCLRLKINQYKPLRGEGYIPLPNNIKSRRACVNVQNTDEYCFRYAILSKFVNVHPERPNSYKNLEHNLNLSCVTFPVGIKDVKKFETINNVSINLFGIDKSNQIYPLKVVQLEKDNHWDLLLMDNGYEWHYMYIKYFNR